MPRLPPPLVLPPPACAGVTDSNGPRLRVHHNTDTEHIHISSYLINRRENTVNVSGATDATEVATPQLSFSPQSLVEPNLDTPSTQYSAAWSPARSTGSNDSSDGLSPADSRQRFRPILFARYQSRGMHVMAWSSGAYCQRAFAVRLRHGQYHRQPFICSRPGLNFGAPSMLDFAPQSLGITNFSQE